MLVSDNEPHILLYVSNITDVCMYLCLHLHMGLDFICMHPIVFMHLHMICIDICLYLSTCCTVAVYMYMRLYLYVCLHLHITTNAS